MASDSEDLEDLEALRQAALATVKARSKDELISDQWELSFENEDGDDELLALREAALKSKGRPNAEDKTNTTQTVFLKPKQSKKNPHQKYSPYASQRNGSWKKTSLEQCRRRPLLVTPPLSSRLSPPETVTPAPESNDILPPADHLSTEDNSESLVESTATTTTTTTTATNESTLLKKRKVGKFSRYDDDDDEDSDSDESILDSSILSSPSETFAATNNKTGNDSGSDVCHSPPTDTRIVTQQPRSPPPDDNSDPVDAVLLEDKFSDSLLQEYEEPVLDIEENGDIDDVIGEKSPEHMDSESPSCEALDPEIPSPKPVEEPPSPGQEVFEARKRKFESTKEIEPTEWKKTISLKGIIPKSRKHRRHHRTGVALHSSQEKESVVPSRDLREQNYDTSKPLSFVSEHRRERVHRKVHKRSRSSSRRKYSGGSLSDDVSRSFQKEKISVREKRSGSSSGNKHFIYPVSSNEVKQRKVIQKDDDDSWCRKIIASKYLSDQSDSEGDNENTFLKRHYQANSHKFDGFEDSVNSYKLELRPKSVLATDRIHTESKESDVRGWISLMENRAKRKQITKEANNKLQQNNNDQSYVKRSLKRPVVNITFNTADSHSYPDKDGVEDRLSAHQRLGVVSKSKQEEKGKDKHHSRKEKSKKDCSKESELDRKIRRIQEMNVAILKRQQEVLKDKEQYG
ncbi:uncharacterized protein LOC115213007 [Argonauta hians]